MIIKKIISRIEKEKYSFQLGFLSLFSIILTRNILESAFEGKQILGFSVINSHSFFMTFLHFPLFYISLFAWIILILKFLSKEKTVKIGKIMLVGMAVIIIAPLIDIIVSRGSGYKLTYLTKPGTITEAHKFLNFTRDLLQVSWGQRIEITLVLIGSFSYIFIKTKNHIKSLIAPIIIYLIIFTHAVLPNTVAKIPFYIGIKTLNPSTILAGGILPIDSQNYSVIFSIFITLAGILIISMDKKNRIKKLFNIKSSFVPILALLAGMTYGISLIFRYYKFFFINPIFYLCIILSILIVVFINRISELNIDSTEFNLIALAIIIFGISLGYIFIILIFISYLIKRFLKPGWIIIFPLFIAGFSLIFQENTFKALIPIKEETIELKGKKLSGWTYFLNGNYKKALPIYLKANSISQEKEIQKRIGQCYLNMGYLEKGIQELENIEKPDYETLLSLGQAYTQNGKSRDAINIYKKAIEKGLSPEEFYVRIAQIASRNGIENELDRAVDKALLYGTPKNKLYNIKADFYFRKNSLNEALSMYNKSLEYNPRSVASITGKAMVLYKQGKIEQAEKQLLKALRIEPKNDAVYNNLGAVYITQKKYKKAEETFYNSLKINPNQEEAYYNLGLIYESGEKRLQALEMYQRALKVNPNYLPAKIKIKVLQE